MQHSSEPHKVEYEKIVNSIPQLAWMTDDQGNIYWYNQRWYEYTGTTLEQMKGWGWRKNHHPDHVDRVVTVLKECFHNGEEWEDTFPLKGKDGKYRWFLSRAKTIKDDSGRVLGWFGTNTDITEHLRTRNALSHSEDRLRHLIDNMSAFVAELDIKGTLKEVNQAALDIGDIKREDVIGKKFWECFWWNYDLEVANKLKDSFLECLKGKTIEYDEIVRIKGDERMYIAFKMVPVTNNNGEITHIIPSGFDITERKKAEEKLNLDNERKNQFIATLSHELRNPLSPVTSILSLLSRNLLPEDKKPIMIDTALKSANHLSYLIDDLLDVTRIQRGKIDLNVERIDLISVLQEAQNENFENINAKKHEFLSLCHEKSIIVNGDATRLRQAVSNIISNAVKYCPPESTIELLCEKTTNTIEITIKDNGPGVPEEMLKDIFEIFVQVDEALNRTEDGLGIGLALVKQLIILHGGNVYASNNKDGGLQVTFTLPVIS